MCGLKVPFCSMRFFQCRIQEICVFCRVVSIFFEVLLENLWSGPVFFLPAVGEKADLKKTLLGVVICANQNWIALLFQDSLVLWSVKCQSWPFGTILVWRLGPRARAPCEGVVSTLLGCAHGPGAIKPHNDTLANQSPQTDITNDTKLDNRP